MEIFVFYQFYNCSAGKIVVFFGKKGDAWGKIFSMCEWTGDLFPKSSGYDELRKSAMQFYESIKVNLLIFITI